jgi:hypothetical protein
MSTAEVLLQRLQSRAAKIECPVGPNELEDVRHVLRLAHQLLRKRPGPIRPVPFGKDRWKCSLADDDGVCRQQCRADTRCFKSQTKPAYVWDHIRKAHYNLDRDTIEIEPDSETVAAVAQATEPFVRDAKIDAADVKFFAQGNLEDENTDKIASKLTQKLQQALQAELPNVINWIKQDVLFDFADFMQNPVVSEDDPRVDAAGLQFTKFLPESQRQKKTKAIFDRLRTGDLGVDLAESMRNERLNFK